MNLRYLTPLIFVALLMFVSVAESQLPPQRSERLLPDTSTLRQELSRAGTDEEKLDLYYRLSSPQYNFPPDTLLAMAEEVDSLDLSADRRAAIYHYIKGTAFSRAESDSSIYHYTTAAQLFREAGDHIRYVSAASQLGAELLLADRILEAEDVILNAIDYTLINDIPEGLEGSLYSQAAALYARTMAYDQAIYMNERVLEKRSDENTQCATLLNMATALSEMKQYYKARKQLLPCLSSDTLHPHILATIESRMGELELAAGDTSRAVLWLGRSAERMADGHNPAMNASILARKGELLLASNNPEAAAHISEKLDAPGFGRLPPPAMLARMVYLASFYQQVGNDEKALDFSEKAIGLAERYELTHELKNVYAIRAAVFESQGNTIYALTETRTQLELNREIIAAKNQREEASARIRYELRMNEASLSSALEKQRNTSLRLWLSLLLSAGLIASLLLIYRRYQGSKASVEDISMRLTQTEAEHQKLQDFITENNNRRKQQEQEELRKEGTGSNGKPAPQRQPEFIAFSKQLKLASDSISHIQAEGNYIKIFRPGANGETTHLLERMSLRKAMELVPSDTFVWLHRSIIANINYIEKISSDSVILCNGTELRMSRRYKKELADSLPSA